jgi:peptide/nickel transport system substrate-binding protein
VKIGRRDFLRMTGIGLIGIAASACAAPTPTQEAAEPTAIPAVQEPEAPQESEAVQEPEAPQETEVEPSEDQPQATTPSKYKERPEFAKLVAEGKLPPVDERLPVNPQVMAGKEIGRYGGEFFSVGNPFSHAFEIYAFMVNNDVTEFTPEYAEGYETSDDYKTYTLHLRKGLKWSDGEPFTSEDFVFFNEDYRLNEEVSPAGPPGWTIVGGKPMEVIALDEHTVQFRFAAPYRPFVNAMSNWNSLQGILHDAAHYMKKWHIKYNPDAEKLAKEEGFDTWAECFISHYSDAFRNGVMGAPTLNPWVPVVWTSDTHVWEANPYYMAVDAEGNQLPYIWKITSAEGTNTEVAVARALSGQVHWLPNQKMSDVNLFRENAEQGDYRVILLKNSLGSQCAIGFNQNHKDPVKRALFQDVRWRRAMSLAINREEINNIAHFGTGTPQQHTLSPNVSFYKEEWARAYAEYDPEQANALLDELGLKWDAEGRYRLGPDGKEFTLFFDRDERPTILPIQETELIREYFEAVGIRTVLKLHAPTLYSERRMANELDFGAWHSDRIEELRCYIPGATKWNEMSETAWARHWGNWRDTQGKLGEEPPPKYKEQQERMQRWYECTTDEDYHRLGQEIWDFFAEDLTVIGTVAFPQAVFILSNKIGNGPEDEMWFGDGMNWYKTFLPATWYFKA